MLYKVNLKNSDKTVLLSEDAYQLISNNIYFQSIEFLKNLRIHSNGYAFYQKNHPTKDGKYKNETIYLHKFLAERLIAKLDTTDPLYVMFKNGNRLDCRTGNLEWATRSYITRNTKKNGSKVGFRGVYKDGNSYRATIYKGRERYELGFFKTPEEAAAAYNKKSEELFGKTKSLNKVDISLLQEKSEEQIMYI